MKKVKRIDPSKLKAGNPCPNCSTHKSRYRPKLKFDSDGNCITVPFKTPTLNKCNCKKDCKGLYCPHCKWSNF